MPHCTSLHNPHEQVPPFFREHILFICTVFTVELEISLIELDISLNELEISLIELDISLMGLGGRGIVFYSRGKHVDRVATSIMYTVVFLWPISE